MIKLFIYIFFGLIAMSSCTFAQSLDAKRKAIINKAITAIENRDTLALFLLVDTAFNFDIYGKEGFLYKVNHINNLLKKCGSVYDKNQLSKKTGNLKSTEYRLAFCIVNDESNADAFYLSFIFPDYENRVKIQLIDVVEKQREIKPNIPVIKQKN